MSDDGSATTTWFERARLAREARGWGPERVAHVLGVTPETYEHWEATGSGMGGAQWAVFALLGVRLEDSPSAVTALGALWARWGTSGGARVTALNALTRWVRLDDQLTSVSTPDTNIRHDCLSARGVPEDPGALFAPLTLPEVKAPRPEENANYSQLGSDLATELCEQWGTTPGEQFDPWTVADALGVGAGRAPLGTEAYSMTARIHDGAAVVVNSDLNAVVQRRALTHALVHLVCGHVLDATWHPVADSDDDSIYCCTGTGWQVCTLVDHAVAWILDPAGAEQDARERAVIDQQIDAGTYSYEPAPKPGPVLSEGEEPGYWHQYEVFVPPVRLRRELGLPNSDLLPAGPGNTTVPARLARRWVAVLARGFEFPVEPARQFPFGEVGCPSVEEVETAIYRARVVRAQLEAWNSDQIRTSCDQ